MIGYDNFTRTICLISKLFHGHVKLEGQETQQLSVPR